MEERAGGNVAEPTVRWIVEPASNAGSVVFSLPFRGTNWRVRGVAWGPLSSSFGLLLFVAFSFSSVLCLVLFPTRFLLLVLGLGKRTDADDRVDFLNDTVEILVDVVRDLAPEQLFAEELD